MTYDEMLQEINSIPMFGQSGGLSNLKEYLTVLNHPERSLRVIHIAGTNGKGSVSAYLESVLREAGYKTALFTSPHLMRINERFRINFQECEDALLVRAWEEVKEILEKREEYGLQMLTYFEIMFLMGMLIFFWEAPDYCIVETGLGGRLDATVLTKPILCIITSISLDHTNLLGDTITQIAEEKAGIIKLGIPVVFLEEKEEVSQVICDKAKENNAEVLKVSYRDITFLIKEKNTIDFSLENRYYKINHLKINTQAMYQTVNAALAITAIHHLIPSLSEEIIRRGIASMRWPGRMEEIAPHVYVDGAHNPGAIEQICKMMEEEMSQEEKQDTLNWSLLFAVCADKDYESMVTMLTRIPWKHIYITKIKATRGAAVNTVAECFRTYSGTPIRIDDTSGMALKHAMDERKEKENILCLGSLYLVGELKEYISQFRESEEQHD